MELVTVRTFDNYFLANISLTKLMDAGIDCYLKDEHTVTIDPLLTNAIGGIKLIVKDTDKEEALQLLQQFDEDYRKSVKCPKCGKSSFVQITKPGVGNYLTAILTWMFSSYAVAPQTIYQCGNCGYEYEQLPFNDMKEIE